MFAYATMIGGGSWKLSPRSPSWSAALDWALDEDERRLAASALEDASDLAREYGRDWTPETVPRLVRTLVLAACVRYLRNPDGYTQSRGR